MRLVTLPGVFRPISDTWLLADALDGQNLRPGARVLDLCAGSGALAIRAALRGDLFEPVAGERFDAIVSNPPYVPAPTDELPARGPARAWDAGRDGRALLDRICGRAPEHLAPGGVVLVVHSSLLGYERTAELLTGGGLAVDLAAQERGPLGPLMNGRRGHLEAEGLLAPGQREEDVLVVRGRKRPCAY